jgi:hypothetical protein
MKRPGFLHCRAMALPMVLWSIALLTAVTLLLAGVVNGWIEEESRAGKGFQARQQALSGLAVAMNPRIYPGDPLLNQGSGEEGWSVKIFDESGLINPNYFLGGHPDRRDLLRQLFNVWKLSPDLAEAAADGLYDWQTPSPFRSLRGAKKQEYEAAGYAGLPPGAPFVSPEEMELVIGFAPVMQAKPEWKSYFTTYYPGAVNLLHAPRRILTDLLGLTPSQADAWIALRNGKDGIEGTEDDVNPGSMEKALALLGAGGSQRRLISDSCTLGGSVKRIESTGRWHGVTRRIVVVCAEGSGNNPPSPGAMLGWSEE